MAAKGKATAEVKEQSSFEVTHVQVYPIREPKGKMKAFARVLLGDQLQLTGLRVFDGSKGLFVSYPNDPYHKGEDFRQLFFPTTGELRTMIESAVLEEYGAAVEQMAD